MGSKSEKGKTAAKKRKAPRGTPTVKAAAVMKATAMPGGTFSHALTAPARAASGPQQTVSAGTFSLNAFVPFNFPTPPQSVDYSKVAAGDPWTTQSGPWALGFGTGACSFAAATNLMLAWARNGGAPPAASWDQMYQDYLQFTGNNNQAYVPISAVLTLWQNTGFGAGSDRIGAFCSLELSNIVQIQDAISIFCGCVIGLWLPQELVAGIQGGNSGNGSVWQLPQGDPTLPANLPNSGFGHYVAVLGYYPRGLVVITWGNVVYVTWEFYRTYVREAYAVLSADWIDPTRRSAPAGFDAGALSQEFQQMFMAGGQASGQTGAALVPPAAAVAPAPVKQP